MIDYEYLALLRGVNVGGNNIIKMFEIKASFEELGFADVITYIQSGNVLFKTSEMDLERLTNKIEETLSKKFNYRSRIVVVSHDMLDHAVKSAPKEFGKEPDKYRYDVIFLKPPLMANDAIKDISFKEGVDTAVAGNGVLYFSKLISKAAQSRLTRIIQLPVYQNMTIRNWNTTTKLLALMEGREKSDVNK